MILLFSHLLTNSQIQWARESLKVSDFISMPEELKTQWAAIDPSVEDLIGIAGPFQDWLKSATVPGDFILVMGEWGTTYLLVQWCFKNDRIPVHVTGPRNVAEESVTEKGIKNTRFIKPVLFRKYQILNN